MNKRLADTAMGREPADLILKNGVIADVFTGRFVPCDVAVKDGMICGLGHYDGENIVDVSGKFVLPGLIDSHLHIESSMVTPPQYALAAVPHGVTTIIADPHEITNVCGEAGLEFMKKSSEGLPLDIKYMLPSCVPAAPFEHSGAVLTAEDTKRLAGGFFGIGEMMNYPGVVSGDEETFAKLIGDRIDGHAPGLTGRRLDAYISAGIKTDHECGEVSEMLEKIGKGMYVAIREGTLSKDLHRLIYGVNAYTYRRCTFCTDDRFIGEIIDEGTIDHMIRTAVRLGADPIMAISVGSYCAAQCYGLDHLGAIAVGYAADLIVIDDPHTFTVESVYKNGAKVAENGKALFEVPRSCDVSGVTDTVHLKKLSADFFSHERPEEFTAIELIPHAITTRKAAARKGDELSKVCVIERHKGTAQRGIGYVTNYGIKNGAVATSVGHDSHNVAVIGDNDADMAAAVNALGTSGGIAVVSGGKVLAQLELEIAGLMTDRGAEYVKDAHDKLEAAAKSLGITESVDPFLSLAFLPLPVIPEIRITDSGLFDVESFKFI